MHRRIPGLLGALGLWLVLPVAGCGDSALPTENLVPMVDAGGTTTTTTETPDLGDTGAVDAADNGAPSTTYPAPHPDVPQVVTNKGPVMKTPKFVPVFFSGDDPDYVSALSDFDAKIGSTSYWTETTSEYGVGPGTALMPILLGETAAATLTDAQIGDWLAAKLNADDPAFPPADYNTLYVLHYPTGTTITLSSTGGRGAQTSCRAFLGYHDETQLDANHRRQKVAYAVIPRCLNAGGPTGIDAITVTESHEMIEAATDPFPMTRTAYGQVDDDHIIWMQALGGGEVSDMCAQSADANIHIPEVPYQVQRSWSNKAAMDGHDPCVPAPSAPYFVAAPVLEDQVLIPLFGTNFYTMGALIPVGESKTIEVDLFSDGDTGGPWTVSARDYSSFGGGSPNLNLTLDRSGGQNGEKLHLTIEVLSQSRRGYETFYLSSKKDGQSHVWFGVVANM